METLLQDLRFGLRSLRSSPGSTLAALLALALGIGATSAIFSVVDGVLLRPLGYRSEGELVSIRGNFAGQKLFGIGLSGPELIDLHDQAPFLSGAAGYVNVNAALIGRGRPERLSVGLVTADFFRVLGVQPLHGRTFEPGEDRQGHEHVAILPWRTFQSRFGGDPGIVGQTLNLDGDAYTVVGVLPRGVEWRAGADDLYSPVGFSPEGLSQQQRGSRYLDAVARLKPGITFEQGRRELDAFADRVRKEWPDNYSEASAWSLSIKPLREQQLGSARLPLLLLMGAVGLVLLIACANVANLLLAKAAARQRELAVRSALGAGRLRLVRQMLTESAIVAAIGAGLGVLLAAWGLDALLAAAPAALPRAQTVRLDGRVLAFTAAIAAATTFVFGLVPAIHGSRPDLGDSLKEGGRGGGGPRAGRLRAGLVVAEVALSLVLLIGAGLLLRSFAEVTRVKPGFDSDHVLTARIALGAAPYQDPARTSAFWRDLLARVRAIPGVESAGATSILPMTGASDRGYEIEGYTPRPGASSPDDQFRISTPGYLSALRIPILRGRDFSEADDAKAPLVLLVNEAWGRHYFPGEEVVGKRLRFNRTGPLSEWRAIAGVVADARDFGLETEVEPILYLPDAQFSQPALTLAVRSNLPVAALAPQLQTALSALDPDVPVFQVRPMEQVVEGSIAPRRFPMQLLALFACIALLLSVIGIYGVTSYSVVQRTHEFGIRMAIGAEARDVLRLVLSRALRLTGLGLVLGLAGAVATGKLLAGLLYGVSPYDPATLLGISLLLAAIALVASYLPARRATAVDPAIALRSE